jgi:WD40 repeat protein
VKFSHDNQRLASCSNDKTIRIWDAETGALQQMLEIGSLVAELSFSTDDCHLITNIGSIDLGLSSSLSIRTPNWSAYCVHADTSWITWNGNNVLWLPSEYRPIISMVQKQTIVMGCASGRVLLMEFKPDVSPLWRQTTGGPSRRQPEQMELDKEACVMCGKPGRLCTGCRSVAYCGKEHQKQDWKRHKTACKKKGKVRA